MSGILDNKSRVIDTLITTEGRKQLAAGGIDIQYVSFTDGGAFYRLDTDGPAQDATARLYLEACQLPQDDITFQADDAGNLQPFRNSDGVPVAGGRILDYSFTALTSSIITGSVQGVTSLTGSQFSSVSETLLASSLDNFRKLYLIATKDKIFEDDGFGLGPSAITYTINNDRPLNSVAQQTTHISALDSIFSDVRFSHKQNFKFLPPINKVSDQSLDRSDHRRTDKFSLGQYSPWGRPDVFGLNYQQVMLELKHYKSLGYEKVINFDPTSSDNKLIGQFFERSFNVLRKLDVIDYGMHPTGNPSAPVAHIFFVGKVEVDDKGTDTFIHIFTIVFE